MLKRRVLTLLSLLLIATMVVIAGCAQRGGAGEIAAMADDNDIVIDMPALVLEFGADGKANMAGIPLADLAGDALEQLAIPADQIDFMMSSNIQHVQINNRVSGLQVLVNGEPIPSLAWDGETLAATADTLDFLGMGMPLLEKALPLLTQLGIAVVAKFPVADGAEAIPLYVEGEGSAAEASQAAVSAYLASVGEMPAKIKLPVFYAEDGSWTVGDMTDTEWTALTQGAIPWQELRILPSALENAKRAGISMLTVSTDKAGVNISINGHSLPTISWANGELLHAIKIAQQAGMLDGVVAGGMSPEELIPTIENLLPMIQATDMEIEVHFPG